MAAGTSAATTWSNNGNARFAAGTDATDSYTVTVEGTINVNQLGIEEGDITFTGGTLNFTRNVIVESPGNVSMLTGIAGGEANTTTTFDSQLTGTTGFRVARSTVVGNQIIVLTNTANTLTGGIYIHNGLNVRLGASGVIPDTNAVSFTTNVASATLDLNGFDETIKTLAHGTVNVPPTVNLGSGTLTLANPAGETFSGNIRGNGGNLVKNGAATFTLAAENTYTGFTRIAGGTLQLGHSLALQRSTLDYNSYGGSLSFGALSQATLGGLTGNQAMPLGNVALQVGRNSSDTTYGGVLSGNGSFTKVGNGTLTLTATNTFLGGTTIDRGKLAVDGSIAGPVTVNVAGTLKGMGAINGNATIDGRVAPGNSLGTIHINGNYIQSSIGILETEIGGLTSASEHDVLEVTGTATLSGRLELPLINGFIPELDDEVTFLTAAERLGSFNSLAVPNLNSVAPALAVRVIYGSDNVRLKFVERSNDIQFDSVFEEAQWSATTSWTGGELPESIHAIRIENTIDSPGVEQRVAMDVANAFVHELTIEDASDKIIVNIEADTHLSSTTAVTIGSNGVVELDGGKLDGSVIAVEAGGLLAGNGMVRGNLSLPGGTLRPGFSVGHLNVIGNYDQGVGGEMLIDIDGAEADEYDTLEVSGSAQLGGSIVFDASNYTPAGTEMQKFEILSAGTLSGSFDSVEWTGNNDLYFLPKYDYTEGVVTLVQGTRGDMNGDGAIDTLDIDLFVFALMSGSEFKFLQKAIEVCDANARFCELPSSQAGGDWSGNGLVDFDDIPEFRQATIGNGLSAGAIEAAVARYLSSPPVAPEPSSALLLTIGLAAVGRRPQRSRRLISSAAGR